MVFLLPLLDSCQKQRKSSKKRKDKHGKKVPATVSFHLINLCTFFQSCQNKQVLRENLHTHKIK